MPLSEEAGVPLSLKLSPSHWWVNKGLRAKILNESVGIQEWCTKKYRPKQIVELLWLAFPQISISYCSSTLIFTHSADSMSCPMVARPSFCFLGKGVQQSLSRWTNSSLFRTVEQPLSMKTLVRKLDMKPGTVCRGLIPG
jgi:hypothetical protein